MKLTYRPEIDGLRAIALISVILYHTHYTLEGAKFFGKKISEINWLKIN